MEAAPLLSSLLIRSLRSFYTLFSLSLHVSLLPLSNTIDRPLKGPTGRGHPRSIV